MKEISLVFCDIAEGVEKCEKMDCNTPRRAMRKAIDSYRKNMETAKFQLSLDIFVKKQDPQQKV